ncbi:MAG: hypothetical protein IJT44_09015 [Clostridia bacterium]|nr:hypothetical protein [Clostridia bacterium]
MLQTMHFIVAGGDARLDYTAEVLRERGYTVTRTKADAGEDYADAHLLILPVPLSRDGVHVQSGCAQTPLRIHALADKLPSDAQVFCGMPKDAAEPFFRRGVRLYDYAAREEFAVRNAAPTAEGVAQILLQTLPITIRGARILITGYGRTARACARLLSAMGAHVTIAARRCSALAFADTDGYRSLYLRELPRFMHEMDAVVNTVPATVLTRDVLEAMRRDCPILEIASAPYGTDMGEARRLGVRVQIAPSLPGKVAPKTAGTILADTVLNILKEGNE